MWKPIDYLCCIKYFKQQASGYFLLLSLSPQWRRSTLLASLPCRMWCGYDCCLKYRRILAWSRLCPLWFILITGRRGSQWKSLSITSDPSCSMQRIARSEIWSRDYSTYRRANEGPAFRLPVSLQEEVFWRHVRAAMDSN